jgi:hypothetical protein
LVRRRGASRRLDGFSLRGGSFGSRAVTPSTIGPETFGIGAISLCLTGIGGRVPCGCVPALEFLLALRSRGVTIDTRCAVIGMLRCVLAPLPGAIHILIIPNAGLRRHATINRLKRLLRRTGLRGSGPTWFRA